MELNKQVCSLELAKKLKKLGVEQDSLFIWHPANKEADEFEIRTWNEPTPQPEELTTYSAFTVAELGEMLPMMTNSKRFPFEPRGEYILEAPKGLFKTSDEFEANARAKMLAYLIENKLLVKKKK